MGMAMKSETELWFSPPKIRSKTWPPGAELSQQLKSEKSVRDKKSYSCHDIQFFSIKKVAEIYHNVRHCILGPFYI